jgi:hypothetical protein
LVLGFGFQLPTCQLTQLPNSSPGGTAKYQNENKILVTVCITAEGEVGVMPEYFPQQPGIASQLKKAGDELKEAQVSVKTGMINVKVLMEFRNATERARVATAAVQQWLEEQGKGNDPYRLLPGVLSERVRMATELVQDVTHDLEAGDIDFETTGLGELNKAVRTLNERLSKLFPQ